jgi:hypothetical protein
MNELRWFQERNPVPTSAQVRNLSDRCGMTMMAAKQHLLNPGRLRLQLKDADGVWKDVPTVIGERAVPIWTDD